MTAKYEIKAVASNISLADINEKEGIIIGYLSVFGNVDKVGDIVEKTAFNKTLNDSKKKLHLLNHDFSMVIGTFDELQVDEKGLRFTANLAKEFEINGVKRYKQLANDVLLLYKEGIITEHSIGYKTIKSELISDSKSQFEFYDAQKDQWIQGYRRLIELKLYEGSTVTLEAANPLATVVAVKSTEEQKNIIEKHIEKLEKLLKNTEISDEFAKQTEIAIEQLKSIVISIEPSKIDTRLCQPSIIDTDEDPQKQYKTLLQGILQNIKNQKN